MKIKTNNILSLVFFLFATLSLPSCQDDADTPAPVNEQTKKAAVANVLALRKELDFVNRFVNDNVGSVSSEGGRTSFSRTALGRLKETAPCTEATEEELPDGSLKITLDFGTGCQADEDIVVAGKVVMVFSFEESTLVYHVEFIDFREIEGNNKDEVANGTVDGYIVLNLETSVFTQQMEQDLNIRYPNNTQAAYKVSQKSEMTENGLRVVSFTTSGNLADGGPFATTIRKALIYNFSCEGDLPTQGEELLSFQGNSILVNYGSGACDSAYMVE